MMTQMTDTVGKTAFVRVVVNCPHCKLDSKNRIVVVPCLDRAGPRKQDFKTLFCAECGVEFSAKVNELGMTTIWLD